MAAQPPRGTSPANELIPAPPGRVTAASPASAPVPAHSHPAASQAASQAAPLGSPTILYAAADLLWATKIKSTGDALGIACRPVRNLDMLNARLADSNVVALLVDAEIGPLALDLIRTIRDASGVDAQPATPDSSIAPGMHASPASSTAPSNPSTTASTQRTRAQPPRVVIFGPHVDVASLRAGLAAGADAALARGALHAQLPALLTQLAAGGTITSQLVD